MKHWPLAGLRIRTDRLQLRWPTEDDIDALADCAIGGIHAPDYMPFFSMWTDGTGEQVAQRIMQRLWKASALWTPQDWTAYFVVVHDGAVIGCQSLGATNFGVLREGLVTAWLGREYQGFGFGLESRSAVLDLAFRGLNAQAVLSIARQDNMPSLAVARKLGFEHDGVESTVVRGTRIGCDRLRLTRERWQTRHTTECRIEGLGACRDMFGLSERGPVTGATPTHQPLASALSGIAYITGTPDRVN